MQTIAFTVVGWTICAAALAVSVRYFLYSKPAGDGPADRAGLIFGRIHPQLLVRTLIAIVTIWSCLLLSNAVAAQGDRILAGLILAVAAPAMLFAALTLFTLPLALLTGEPKRPMPVAAAKMTKPRIAAWIFIAVIIVAAALIPILR